METVTAIIIGFEILIFLLVIAILVYLIAKRIKDKGKENFEKRDN